MHALRSICLATVCLATDEESFLLLLLLLKFLFFFIFLTFLVDWKREIDEKKFSISLLALIRCPRAAHKLCSFARKHSFNT